MKGLLDMANVGVRLTNVKSYRIVRDGDNLSIQFSENENSWVTVDLTLELTFEFIDSIAEHANYLDSLTH